MLRKIKFLVLAIFLAAIFQSYFLTDVQAVNRKPFFNTKSFKNIAVSKPLLIKSDDEVVVKFKSSKISLKNPSLVSKMLQMGFEYTNNLSKENVAEKRNTVVYKTKNKQNIDELISELKSDKNIEYAEPNYVYKQSAINTNDTYKANLWGLDNTGQVVVDGGENFAGTTNADINFPEAMAISTGTTDVIVAVIDSGVAYNHPDLSANMWDGTNCKDENGNSLGGCIHGYDFADNDNDPAPNFDGHGTHVSGTIAAAYNNGKGTLGFGTHIKIMALRCGDGTFKSSCIARSIDFARENGARVINASFGGNSFSQAQYDAIVRFRDAGGIFVAAAGNESTDNETVHSYPSDYDLANIISVASIDMGDQLSSFSNYGSTSVDVAAPGEHIMSTSAKNVIYSENFDTTTTGSIPTSWQAIGSTNTVWGAAVSSGSNKAFYTDYLHNPVLANANNYAQSGTINLNGTSKNLINMITTCWSGDSDPALGGSYVALEASSDGTTFNEVNRWNKYSLENDFGMNAAEIGTTLPSQYNTANFKFRLKWVTDSSPSGGGCAVDNITVENYTNGAGEAYEFMNGTSMATPHVAGLAGYLWSVSPSSTTSKVIDAIVNYGDSLSNLAGKTVSGKRIDAYNSLVYILGDTTPVVPSPTPTIGTTGPTPTIGTTTPAGPTISGITDDAVPSTSKTWVWSSDDSGAEYRFSIDQNISGTITGTYGVGTSTVYATGNGTYYLHVQGRNSNQVEGAVKTVSFIMDHLGPSLSLTNQSNVGATSVLTLTANEAVYNHLGVGLSAGNRLDSQLVGSTGVVINSAIYNDQNKTLTIDVTGMTMGSRLAISTNQNDKLFDNLGNSSTFFLIYSGQYWQLNPTIIILPSINVGQLVNNQLVTETVGSTAGQDISITVLDNISINATGLGVTNSVILPVNTQISELNNHDFDPNQIQINNLNNGDLSGLASNFSVVGAMQWGITGTTLKFSNPITIRINVGSANEGKTLSVFRSLVNNGSWTVDGLVNQTCLVTGSICQFDTNQASYYAVASFQPSNPPAQNNNNNNGGNNNNGSPGAPMCTDISPTQKADLFKIKTEKGTAKLYYTPVNGVSGYAVLYGLKQGDERYGAFTGLMNNNEGEQNFTIGKLNPKQKYYFKIAAVKGCTSGPWSEWIPAKADRKATIDKYKKVNLGKGLYKLVSKFI